MIAAIRSSLFLAIVVVWTVVFCSFLLLFCFWLPHYTLRQLGHGWTRPVTWLIRHMLGIGYELRGHENIVEPAVILCKHQSAWETIVLQEIFPDLLFVWKKELKLIPFFGWGLALMPMISIDRGAGKDALRQLLTQGKLRLSQGYSVAVFPEGTRVAPGNKRRYKIGGAYLAVDAGAPIVPVALNSGEVWGRNALFKRPGKVIVHIGPRIDTKDITAEEANARAERWIETEMRNISPHLYRHEAA
ncbi:MAG: lysophospholipid acyltransferase family protein [Georgfuchsia sp.]